MTTPITANPFNAALAFIDAVPISLTVTAKPAINTPSGPNDLIAEAASILATIYTIPAIIDIKPAIATASVAFIPLTWFIT